MDVGWRPAVEHPSHVPPDHLPYAVEGVLAGRGGVHGTDPPVVRAAFPHHEPAVLQLAEQPGHHGRVQFEQGGQLTGGRWTGVDQPPEHAQPLLGQGHAGGRGLLAVDAPAALQSEEDGDRRGHLIGRILHVSHPNANI